MAWQQHIKSVPFPWTTPIAGGVGGQLLTRTWLLTMPAASAAATPSSSAVLCSSPHTWQPDGGKQRYEGATKTRFMLSPAGLAVAYE
ncbi:hypothetical protein LTR12_001987 [Friedmanniomyces endolithicus]|nr:hypothetical protein LTR74_011103 [Friedmanniomyces endolithicus]KAK1823576.1 hypothetical protein LTR12_001987 [Friedmanniomyces endolithicus]